MKNAAKRLISSPVMKSTVIYTVGDSLGKAIPFLLLPIVARYLTTSDFGIVTNFSVAVQIYLAICALNTYSALTVSYYALPNRALPGYLSNLVYLILTLAAVCGLSSMACSGLISRLLGIPAIWQYLALLTAVSTSIFMLYMSLLRMQNRVVLFNGIQIFQSLAAGVLAILFVVVWQWNWQGRALSLAASAIFTLVLSLWLMTRSGYLFKEINVTEMKSAFFFGLPLLPHTLSFWFKSGMDKIIVTNYIGLSANGVYSVALTLGGLIGVFTGSFFNAYSPVMYKDLSTIDNVPEEEGLAIKKKLVKITYLFAVLLLLVCIGSFFVMKYIVLLFFSGGYLGAVRFMPFVMTTLYFEGMYSIVSGYIFYRKKTKYLGTITFCSSMLQILTTFLLVRSLGVMGAAYSSCLISLITFLAVLCYANTLYKLPWTLKKTLVVAPV